MENFKYEQYAQTYSTSQKRFIPKDVKVRLFWDQYPNGCIEVSIPQKDPEANGVICTCNLYRYAHDKEHSLIASSFARRTAASTSDAEAEDTIDLYASVRAAAISDALSLAGIDLPLEIMYSHLISNGEEEEVVEEETKKQDIPEDISDGCFVEEKIPGVEEETETTVGEMPEAPEMTNEINSDVEEPEKVNSDEEAEIEDNKEIIASEVEANEENIPPESDVIEETADNNDPCEEPDNPNNDSEDCEIEESDVPEINQPADITCEEPISEPTEHIETPEEEENRLLREVGKTYEEILEIEVSVSGSVTEKMKTLLEADTLAHMIPYMCNPKRRYSQKNPLFAKYARIVYLHNIDKFA